MNTFNKLIDQTIADVTECKSIEAIHQVVDSASNKCYTIDAEDTTHICIDDIPFLNIYDMKNHVIITNETNLKGVDSMYDLPNDYIEDVKTTVIEALNNQYKIYLEEKEKGEENE